MVDQAENNIEQSRAPLVSHLAEVRQRLMYIIIAVVRAFVGCFFVANDIFTFLVEPPQVAMEDAGYGDANDDILDNTGVILGVTAGMKLLGSLTSRLQYPIWEKVLIRSGISENDTKKIIEKMKKQNFD